MQQQGIVTLELITCGKCGIVYGMPEHFVKERRESGASFFCPNGHERVFGEPEIGRLKKELAAKERQVKQYQGWYKAEQSDHEHTRNRLRSTKGVLTKTKKRVGNGVCPCCNRTFKDLARHMVGQHPDYATEGEQAG